MIKRHHTDFSIFKRHGIAGVTIADDAVEPDHFASVKARAGLGGALHEPPPDGATGASVSFGASVSAGAGVGATTGAGAGGDAVGM